MLNYNLPDPTGYKNFKPKTPIITYKGKKSYNIQEEIKRFNFDYNPCVRYFELVEMFGNSFIGLLDYQSNKNLKAINSDMVEVKSYVEYYYNENGNFCTFSSLAILLYDENKNLKTATIRRYRNPSGQFIKWYKVRGSQTTFIPYRLTSGYSYCFVAFGMSEAIIFNILGLDYFILQSDSISFNIDKNPYFNTIKKKLQGRDIFILPDYDESGLKAGNTLKKHLESFSNPRIIELYKLAKNPQKGYDLRDFILENQDKKLVIEKLLDLI